MSTYDAKQVLADYASGKLTPEMAVGHSLQHIDKLTKRSMRFARNAALKTILLTSVS